MKLDLAQILYRPIITERATVLKKLNQYVFEVSLRATKGQIREAVREAFRVDVVAVRTLRSPGKYRKKMGPRGGYAPDRKKAVIEIKAGQEIKLPDAAG